MNARARRARRETGTKNKKAWIAGLVIGILLMVASMVITVALATPLTNDPNRAIIGNGDFWYEYYFAKTTSWMLLLGACVSIVSCAMLVLHKK